MSVMATGSPEVAAYLAEVRAALADVPSGEREELLADVETSLIDALSEGEGSLEDRLGPPSRFAEELRRAAGLGPVARAAPRARALARVRALAARASDLAPLWWVARAYVAVAAVGLLLGSTWPDRPVHFVPMLHSGSVTIAACVVALVASLWLGRRGYWWLPALNALLLLAIIPVAVHDVRTRAWQTPAPPAQIVVASPSPQDPLSYRGAVVQNIYAYDRAGRLLHDVRLYDEAGHPLDVGAQDPKADPLRRLVRARGGKPVLNAFPIRYFEPGTRRVAHPDAAPRARVTPLR